MTLGDRWVGRWHRWQHRHWSLGVDDSGDAVRWVCLRRAKGQQPSLVSVGQWALGDEAVGLARAGLRGLPIALGTCAVVQRGQVMPDGLADEDHTTWVRARMAQIMGLSPSALVVDWGSEANGSAPAQLWLAAVRASVFQQRVQWAHARGAALRILESRSAALARALCLSAQAQTDPIWLWWAARDEGHVCTGWWHGGRWHDRCDVAVDLRALGEIPGVLLGLVKSAQTHKTTLQNQQWWWAGEPLAPWAAQWAADPARAGRTWVCQAAPVPMASSIEALTQAPAHAWALAMGLALHPGWAA